MRGYVIKTRAFTMQCRYLHKKNSGLFYFRRPIPENLRVYYMGKAQILRSLKTRDEATAVRLVLGLTHEYDKEFDRLRKGVSVNDEAERIIRESGLQPKPMSEQTDRDSEYNYAELMREIGESIETIEAGRDGFYSSYDRNELDPVLNRVEQILNGRAPLTLSDAMARLLKVTGDDRVRRNEIERHFHYFIDKLQEDDIGKIGRERVESVIDAMPAEGKKPATIKKYVSTVSKGVGDLLVFNDSTRSNPFRNVFIAKLGTDVIRQHTFTATELATICASIRAKPHLVSSLLIGMLVNTGCRVSEVAGLTLENINVSASIPHIDVTPQSNRGLKTKNSERLVPLIGISLEFAKRLVSTAKEGQTYAYPNWNKTEKLARNSASATGNKALGEIVGHGTTHSFRHTMNTRLKEAGVNGSAIDDLLGWADKSMNKYYGKPDLLRISRDHLKILEVHEACSDEGYSGV